MSVHNPKLPQIGDIAPPFTFRTPQGEIDFHEYSRGYWCVFFAHPANFTSAWMMFSAFLAKKERWLNERNSKAIALSTVPISQNDWSDKARRFIGIHLKAPVLEDLDFRVANLYGMASGRRPQPGCDRLAFIIDPEGIIRHIITRPLMPDIESALLEIEAEFHRLQGNLVEDFNAPSLVPVGAVEQSDATERLYKPKPAHFSKKKISPN
ncbi:MAG TPA: redoxin domain-containing protein [Saprospiraceae bacterium]|nr:redoxin domain-containing protein [Saprospiraceae bacterium]